ncbi:MAG TPA: hypothetical protein VM008_20410 [Phycisphaerae bacterium]|nr:hypothetical protein [Phycisphaerae bacterium]
MSEQVRVDDLEIFGRFRVAMIKFAQAANEALGSADSEISRTHSWLETEQRTYWEGQLRKRTEAVTKAREAVRQKKLYKDSSGRTPGAVEEEKFLAKCIAAVAHAEERLESVRRWLPRLERAAGMYRSGVAGLSKTVDDDVPKAIALLDRLADSLQQYLQIEGAAGGGSSSLEPGTAEPSMSRGGDAKNEIAPVTTEPRPVATPEKQDVPTAGTDSARPVQKEGSDVPVGQ